MEINQLIEKNSAQVKNLLKKFKVEGPADINTIRIAHNLYGADFMTRLMAILTPGESFTGPGAVILPGSILDQNIQSSATQPQKGKFWSFLNNLLSGVERTGQTIGQFKADVNTPYQLTEYQLQQQQQRSHIIWMVAGIVVLVILILLLRKN